MGPRPWTSGEPTGALWHGVSLPLTAGNPGPENLAADQMMLFPPRASPVGRLGTDFALGLLPSGTSPVWDEYQTLLSEAKMPAVASCGPLQAPPQRAAQASERARRGEGYRKAHTIR